MSEETIRAITALAGVSVGFILARAGLWFDRRHRTRTHKGALLAEIDLCEADAKTYITDPVASPLYRLPTSAFETAFSSLLVDGALSRGQVKDLELYFGLVQQINRGLEYAHDARVRDDQKGLAEEVNRLLVKCRRLVDGVNGGESYVVEARLALLQMD